MISNKNLTNIHLISIQKRDWPQQISGKFPFNLPFIKNLSQIEFTSPVTILVGENGSGKSTFLEALACSTRLATIGSVSAHQDPSLLLIQQFSNYLKLSWKKRTHRGFFLRAEDFFGFAKKIKIIEQELIQDLQDVDDEYSNRSTFALNQAKMAYKNELSGIKNSYGEGLDSKSHGESFLKVFQARFVPDGLYLMDEPEAPLSPLRQLAFLTMLKEMVDQNSQFIFATHSPILMSYPGSLILNFEDGKINPVNYADIEHVTLTRSFLNNPALYLKQLWDE